MKKLIADEGYVYCNGWAAGRVINLPDAADESPWKQVTPEVAELWIEETIRKEEEREKEDPESEQTDLT